MTRRGGDEYVTLYEYTVEDDRGEMAKTDRGSNENLINGACNDEADAYNANGRRTRDNKGAIKLAIS